jgi:hypothetical protein
MRLLFVSRLDRSARAVAAITRFAAIGKRLGHEVAVFGEPRQDFESVPHSVDVNAFDFALFVVYEAWDFPELPHLAHLLDRMPKERRVIVDCTGTYNETITVEHDSNHLEQLNGHQGWEWVEGFDAVAKKVLQPTLTPLRNDVGSFLLFGYDPLAVARPYRSAEEASKAWSARGDAGKPHGIVYVGHNWQRWTQLRRFFEAVEPLKHRLGSIQLRGWAWDQRPDWAVEHGFAGVDVDPDLLKRLGVEVGGPIPFDEVIEWQGRARFCPIFHRPLFNQLGLVTNRTFETFCSDTIPLLMLPHALVGAIYGRDALPLAPGDDVRGRLEDMMRRPEVYWDAVLKTRDHLAARHSYERRFEELVAALES